jgi:hypothetical protein
MTNTIWDVHYYPWLSDNSGDEDKNAKVLAGIVNDTSAIPSADGKMPVIIGEYGPLGPKPIPDATTRAVQHSGYGAIAWALDVPEPYNLLGDSNRLSGFGSAVRDYVSQSNSSGCAESPIPARK